MDNETVVERANNLSTSQEQIIVTLSWWLETFIYMLVGVIGLAFNMIAILSLCTILGTCRIHIQLYEEGLRGFN